MKRFAWLGAVWAMLGPIACADDDADDSDRDAQLPDASLDASMDAHVGDSGIDARTDANMDANMDTMGPDARADAQSDARGNACDVSDFIAAHQACSADQDCTIVGGCSGGFGFYAVNVAARDEAQRLSDQTPRECAAYDGPLYNAVCEQSRCRRRPTGHACGEAPLLDGGTTPDRCPSGQELYDPRIGDGARSRGCYQRCSGPSDPRCGAGETCQETEICAADALNSATSCGPFTTGLCRP